MLKNKVFRLLAFLLGFAAGAAILATAGAFYLHYKHKKNQLARYDAVAPEKSEAGSGARIFVASSLDRVFQDGKTLVKPVFTNDVKISAARNEYEAFQVVVAAGNETLSEVTLEISIVPQSVDQLPVASSPLDVNRSQATGYRQQIPAVTWSVVGYVPTVTPYYPVKYVGPWPDPLFPSQDIGEGKSVSSAPQAGPSQGVDIESGLTQSFWVSIYVPPRVVAGSYQGLVRVKGKEKILKEIPLELKVYPFSLPVVSHLKTAFDFYGHITNKRYPQKANETTENYQARLGALNQKFLQMMLVYRMGPILNIDPTNNKELSTVDRLRILGLNNFSIGKKGGTFNNNWPQGDKDIEALLPLYRTYGELLKLNGLLKDNYIYTWDEGDIGNPLVAKISSMIHRAYPGLKNMVCYHGFWDPQELPDWGKDIDIWCFNIDNFVESKMRALQKAGKEMWLYVSSPEGKGSPNLAMDFDSISYRMIPWLCWKYDIKGFLYWCVNWWERVDPFLSAQNTKWENNGNGLLFYPGPDGPWPSLRAETWRDGMEDYEYIQILMQRLIEMKKRRLDETHREFYEQAKTLLMVDESIAKDMFSFNKDANVLMERREKIAEAIVEAEEILNKSQDPSIK